ncbi:CaiB/BaiF CoA transferase family protein [Nesterenkonia cremea]|uniref:CoA transferase n=1 Tax=Nesterenkonia cremea TaxID=1882340 RepID=A0A917AVP4_9MICC|nr:CoA transferase [Nesterenkonia cremea]GGE78360.1 CoA transferase [Nesterenkonia cremea]
MTTTPPTGSEQGHSGPLAGVVVLDLSRVLAGPYATMLLSDLGATVIKVESPQGDETRTWRPPERDGESTYFQSVNRNKHSIALDLGDEQDRETLEALLVRADVLVENFKPGGLARFGLDYPTLSQKYPGLIYASLSGFGHEGPGAKLPGYDVLAQGASGLMHVTGSPDGEPTKAGVAVVDVISGLHLYGAVLAALYERTSSGKGQHLTANLMLSMLSGLVNQTSAAANTGISPRRMGNEHPSLFPYGPFRTADGEIIIACGNNGQFARLCTVLGCPEAAEDSRWESMAGRNEHRDALRELLEEKLVQQSSEHWSAALREVGVPSAPINDVVGGLDFARQLGMEPTVELTREDGTSAASVAHPVKWSRSEISYRSAPPRLDENREQILRWLQG